MNLIGNQRTKLAATYFEPRLATAIFAVGGLAPFSSHFYDPNSAKPTWLIALVASVCIVISGALHLIARSRLGALAPGMSNVDFLVAFSVMPVGGLLLGILVYYL